MEKYKKYMILQPLGYKKANKAKNMAEIVFLREGGGGGVKCKALYVYQKDNVNLFEICNNWIKLNMMFHAIITFFANMKA